MRPVRAATLSPSRLRRALSALALLWAADAAAIGLGTAVLDSGLGEPLRLSLPVTAQPDEEIGCIQVRARGNDLPSVFNTRSNVVRSRGQTRIEITSAQAVNEPAIGLVVSVGCTSAVAREFVLFLDPPIPAPAAALNAGVPRSVVEPTVPRGLSQSTPRTARAARGVTDDGSARPTTPRPPRAPRPSRQRAPSSLAPTAPLPAPQATAPTPVPPPSSPAIVSGGDRLSVVPTEPRPTASPSAPANPSTTGSPAPAAPPAATSNPTAEQAAAAADLNVREQALRQQQEALQAQLKSLGDQIAALRTQTAGLAARNQELQDRVIIPPVVVWALVVLALLAIIVAVWMSRRYNQLREQVEGSPWWTGNTTHATSTNTELPVAATDGFEGGLPPLDPGTRMTERPGAKEARTSHATSSQNASNAERSRPMARVPMSSPTIETDFTASDIEAAMATVRTVPSTRSANAELEDSDFNPLGGPTVTSPFDEPAVPSSQKRPVDKPADFVSMQIPPKPSAGAPAAASMLKTTPDATKTHDFKLDEPNDFDPLATNTLRSTEVERTHPGSFEMQALPTALDFELPSMTTIMPLTETDPATTTRHGSTVLDNLFASDTGKLGADTILDLDDRHGEPLSVTEVNQLTGAIEGDAVSGMAGATVQQRMTRFADFMNHVEETALTEPLRAIAQLRQFVLRDEDIPTLLWLRLFELYKIVDKKMVYEALAEHFARRYHRTMVGWNETLADRVPQTPLSTFTELDREIGDLWATEAGLARVHALLCGRDQSDAIVFNMVLQRDLLDTAKIFHYNSSIIGKTDPSGA